MSYPCCYRGCDQPAIYGMYSDIPPNICVKHAKATEDQLIKRVRDHGMMLCSSKLVTGGDSKWFKNELHVTEIVETGGDILSTDAAVRALLQVKWARQISASDVIDALREAGFALAHVRPHAEAA